MIINIAIVDDEANFRDELKRQLLNWEEKNGGNWEVVTKEFCSEKEFLMTERKFEIIFLDIEMENRESGMRIAQKLRKKGDQTPMVFLTMHKEWVYSGYKVFALNYIVKPIKEKDIFWCMNQVVRQVSSTYYIHSGRNSFKIKYIDILYFEAQLHYIYIFTSDSVFKKLSTIKKEKEGLPQEFVQCHRSYIVNIKNVISLRNKSIVLVNNKIIDYSERYREKVRELYFKEIPR